MPLSGAEPGILDGKAIVITGAGSGLGAAYARLAAAEGACVVVNDVDSAAALRVVQTIRDEGGEATVHCADISSWNEAESLIETCVSSYGRLDGLVNNAALFHMALAVDETEDDLRRIFGVNVLGTAFCGLAALRRMLRQKSGSLVNVTSGAQAGMRGMSAYGATKGAVASLTYGWALEVEGTGVRVNAVSPIAQTRMVEANKAFTRSRGEVVRPITVPPENNAPLMIYLLSDRSASVNGQVVRMDGKTLSLMTHPAVLQPGVSRNGWTVQEVESAFSSVLDRLQLPIGLVKCRAGIDPAQVPAVTWVSSDGE